MKNPNRHKLYGVQEALSLPDSYEFGDVLDVISRSLLEDLVYLSACNIVHRDCESNKYTKELFTAVCA